MRGGSLRLRLLAAGVVAVVIAIAAALLAMSLLFERHLTRAVEAELVRTGIALAAALRLDANGQPIVDVAPVDPRFEEPASGLYWQVETPAGAVRSRSLWDQALPAPAGDSASGAAWISRRGPGPFGPELLIVARQVRPDRGGPVVLLQAATDFSSIALPRDAFARELALFLVVLGVVLALAAWVQVVLGLAPLGKVRAALAAMERDPAVRLAAESLPSEVAPLAAAIDSLAAAREDDLERARRRAADLAHSLKTPLAALAAETRRAREAGASDAAEGLERAQSAIAVAVEGELARARVAAAGRITNSETEFAPVVERLVGVIERTEVGGRVVFDLAVPAGFQLPLAAEDLAEIAGPILENAARYARRRVRVEAAAGADGLEVRVQDDGPGLDAARATDALLRGVRLDETAGGHGLGLAIARDLVAASGGEIALGRSAEGGLSVRIVWPPRSR